MYLAQWQVKEQSQDHVDAARTDVPVASLPRKPLIFIYIPDKSDPFPGIAESCPQPGNLSEGKTWDKSGIDFSYRDPAFPRTMSQVSECSSFPYLNLRDSGWAPDFLKLYVSSEFENRAGGRYRKCATLGYEPAGIQRLAHGSKNNFALHGSMM